MTWSGSQKRSIVKKPTRVKEKKASRHQVIYHIICVKVDFVTRKAYVEIQQVLIVYGNQHSDSNSTISD